jgi:hypothetical protein
VRRYLAVLQDHRGYPSSEDELDPAPPEGPEPPILIQVVKADEHDAEVERLREELRIARWDADVPIRELRELLREVHEDPNANLTLSLHERIGDALGNGAHAA